MLNPSSQVPTLPNMLRTCRILVCVLKVLCPAGDRAQDFQASSVSVPAQAFPVLNACLNLYSLDLQFASQRNLIEQS